jgi:hypothetical protein
MFARRANITHKRHFLGLTQTRISYSVYVVFLPAGRKNDIHEEIKYHAAAG